MLLSLHAMASLESRTGVLGTLMAFAGVGAPTSSPLHAHLLKQAGQGVTLHAFSAVDRCAFDIS